MPSTHTFLISSSFTVPLPAETKAFILSISSCETMFIFSTTNFGSLLLCQCFLLLKNMVACNVLRAGGCLLFCKHMHMLMRSVFLGGVKPSAVDRDHCSKKKIVDLGLRSLRVHHSNFQIVGLSTITTGSCLRFVLRVNFSLEQPIS